MEKDFMSQAVEESKLPLSEQEKLIAELNDFVQGLGQRLSPVLRPSYPTDTEKPVGADREESSPLNIQLRANNKGINAALNRLRDISGRIEI